MEATVLVPSVAGGTVEPHRSSLEGVLSALLICHCTDPMDVNILSCIVYNYGWF